MKSKIRIFVLSIIGAISLIVSSYQIQAQLPYYLDINQERFEFKGYCSLESHHKHDLDNQLKIPTVFRPYDVLHYDIFLDWYDMMNMPMKLDTNGHGYLEADDLVWTGKNKMTIRIDTAELRMIELDSRELVILDVLVNDKPVDYQLSSNFIRINLDEPAKQDDIIEVTIEYRHIRYEGQNSYLGFHLYPKRQYVGIIPVPPNDSAFIEERIAYTMNEPQNARFWLPSNDAPHDKATVTMKVRVPAGYSVASNGLLQEIIKNDTAWIHHWHSSDVMTTYLIHVTASIFTEWSDWYKKITNPQDSIEIKYYVWQKDYDATKTDQSQYNALWTFEQNIEQMEAFVTAFGEYPFEKYGIVSLQPFSFGGMEHQTITSINRVWMRQNARWGLAHELAHMWLGDLVTCKTWNDIWVNEGGATWSEALWTEYVSNHIGYLWDMLNKRGSYLRSGGDKLPPIYGLPINTIFGQYAVLVYQKSSWIYHQLRMILGDEVFFPALRSLLSKYAHTSIDHLDYIKSFTEDVPDSPIDFETYFNQWLMKKGHPIFELDVTTTYNGNNNYLANVSVTQTQKGDDISDIFIVPVRIAFEDGEGMYMADTLWQRERTVSKTFEIPFHPKNIYIDSTFTLCEVKDVVSNIKESNLSSDYKISIAPNPLHSGNIANIIISAATHGEVSLQLFNLLGHQVKHIYSGFLETGTYNFSINTLNLTPGVYFIKYSVDNKTLVEKLIVQ